MVDKQPIIHTLQDKADEANKSSRWWDMVSWAGFVAWIGLDYGTKPSSAKTIGSWAGFITSLVASVFMFSRKSRADAFQESINEIRNVPELPATIAQTDWQQKIAVEPSQEVASTIIRR